MKRILLALILFTLAAYAQEDAATEPPETSPPETQPPVVYDLAFPELPFESQFVEVNGVRLHYLEAGDPDADPILLLHGIPAWSYIWRDVIDVLAPSKRVIALDFPGFGKSENIQEYSMENHTAFLEGFVDALELDNSTLVVQDLGSVAGLSFAANSEARVSNLVFMEAAVPPLFPIPFDDLASAGAAGELWSLLLTPGLAEESVLNQNFFIEEVLPQMILRDLSEAETNAYRAPFPTPEDRVALLGSSPAQVNLYEGVTTESFNVITEDYLSWMGETEIPMLHLWVEPGVLGGPASAEWAEATVQNLTQVKLGPGAHFIQEDYPLEIGQEIVNWLDTISE